MADIITNSAQLRLGSGFLDWTNNTVVACLYNSSASFSATSENYSSTNELSTAYGYTQLNKSVTDKTVSLDAVNNHTIYDCGDITWTASGGNIGPARYCAFVDTLSGVNKYIYIIDFTTDKTANTGTDFKITIDSSGLFRSRQA
jgi:hypothetical protein